MSLSLNVPDYVHNAKAVAWIEEVAALCKPDAIHWCDGSQEEYDRLCEQMVQAGTFQRLNPAKRPNCFLALSDPSDVARVEDRTFICSLRKAGCRPHQQLGGSAGDEGEAHGPVRRLHEGPHPLRDSLQHGTPGLQHRPHRHRAHRLALRGREHAHHDPHGAQGLGRPGRGRLRALPALRGSAPAARREGRALALQPGGEVHRPLPRGARHLVLRQRLRRQRPARQEVLRPAHRQCHGPGRGLARRAHADPGSRGARRREDLRGRGLPQRLRQDQLRHAAGARAVPGLQGHHHRRRHRLDQARARTASSTPSIPRPASSAWRRARA